MEIIFLLFLFLTKQGYTREVIKVTDTETDDDNESAEVFETILDVEAAIEFAITLSI